MVDTAYLSIGNDSRQEQQEETFKKHQADLKDRKVSDLQEKLEAKRKGIQLACKEITVLY